MIKLKFTLNQIYEETYSGPFEFEETVDVSDIPLTIESDIRKISTVDVTGLCTVDKKEIIFNFSIKGEIILPRSEEHTSELQSRGHIVCRLLLENKKIIN